MPTALYPDIRSDQRAVHVKYGRGVVKEVRRGTKLARVLFDDDAGLIKNPPPRTVLLEHLTPEPSGMPVAS